MAYFNKDRGSDRGSDSRRSNDRGFGNDRGQNRGFGGNRDGGRSNMHSATCSECGNTCKVPFRPSGDKPVYCLDCFKRRSNEGSHVGGKSYSGNRDAKPRYNEKPFIQNSPNQNTENYKAQFENVNTKLDKILRVLYATSLEEQRKTIIPQKLEKTPRKEIDAVGLKEAIADSIPKKSTSKKKSTKKRTSKKKTNKQKK